MSGREMVDVHALASRVEALCESGEKPTILELALDAVRDLAPIVTREEVAKFLRICVRSVDRLLATGELRPLRTGRRVVVARGELANYLARLGGA